MQQSLRKDRTRYTIVGDNGLGKTTLVNGMLILSAPTAEEYRTNNEEVDDANQLIDIDGDLEAVKDHEAEQDEARRPNDARGESKESNDEVAQEHNREAVQYMPDTPEWSSIVLDHQQRFQKTVVKSINAFKHMQVPSLKPFYLLPSGLPGRVTTCCLIHLRYGRRYQLRVSYCSERQAKAVAFELVADYRAWVEAKSKGEHNEKMYSLAEKRSDDRVLRRGYMRQFSVLTNYKVERTDDFCRLIDNGLLPKTADEVELHPEVKRLVGRAEIYAGRGQDVDADRVYVRQQLLRLMFGVLDEEDMSEEEEASHSRVRFLFSRLYVYAPNPFLQHAEVVDSPGSNDPDYLNKQHLKRAMKEADVLILMVKKSLKDDENIGTALLDSGFLGHSLLDFSKRARVEIVHYPEKDDGMRPSDWLDDVKLKIAQKHAATSLHRSTTAIQSLVESAAEDKTNEKEQKEEEEKTEAPAGASALSTNPTPSLTDGLITNSTDVAKAMKRITVHVLYPLLYLSLVYPDASPHTSDSCPPLTSAQRDGILDFSGMTRFLRLFQTAPAQHARECLERFVTDPCTVQQQQQKVEEDEGKAEENGDEDTETEEEEKGEKDQEEEEEEKEEKGESEQRETRSVRSSMGVPALFSPVVSHGGAPLPIVASMLREVERRLAGLKAQRGREATEQRAFHQLLKDRADKAFGRRPRDMSTVNENRIKRQGALTTSWVKLMEAKRAEHFGAEMAPLFDQAKKDAHSYLENEVVSEPPYLPKTKKPRAQFKLLFASDTIRQHRAKLTSVLAHFFSAHPLPYADLQQKLQQCLRQQIRQAIYAEFHIVTNEIFGYALSGQPPHITALYHNIVKTTVDGELERNIDQLTSQFFTRQNKVSSPTQQPIEQIDLSLVVTVPRLTVVFALWSAGSASVVRS